MPLKTQNFAKRLSAWKTDTIALAREFNRKVETTPT